MNIAVIGAGAWGTALAMHLQREGHRVTLAPRRIEQALEIASSRINQAYLPGFELPYDLQVGCEVRPAVMEARMIVLACPSAGLRAACERVRPHLVDAWAEPLVLALCKGLDPAASKLPSEVMTEALPDIQCAILTGPSHAADVAQGLPTALVLASGAEASKAIEMQEALSGEALRVYRSDDVRGVEIGGSLKNVYAIAAGVSDGLRLGDNARAALLTRAMAEMTRLGTAWGGRPETFYGLSGFGDLVATSHGAWSRNRSFGVALGQGQSAVDWVEACAGVVEGHRSSGLFYEKARQDQLEAPILREVCAVVDGQADPKEAMARLMQRDLKAEA